jgi:ketosteroid isomerase-like protein
MKTAALIVAVALTPVSGLTLAQARTDPVLDKLATEFAAAYNAHDAARVASFYADDAVLMIPNEPMTKGRTNIETHYKEDFARGAVRLRIRPFESVVAGDRAFEAGTATATLGPLTDDGKYIVIYKRVGREWKIAYDIFNSDQTEPSTRNPDTRARIGF